MDTLATLITWLERLAAVLGYAAIPALVVAIVLEWRRGLAGEDDSPIGILGAAVVAATTGVGLAAALATEVPIGIGASGVAVIVLTGVLLRGRRAFWVVFALLTVVVTIAGVLQLLALAYNVTSSSGTGQFGVRQLVAFGGINANPARPGWVWALVGLSTLGVGVPLGFSLSTAWVGATAAMGRVTRLALVLASGSVGVAVLTSTVLYLFAAINAAMLGLPWQLAVPAVLAGVLLLVLIGPGQVAALFAPTRLLFMRGWDAARAVAETAGAAGEATGLGAPGPPGGDAGVGADLPPPGSGSPAGGGADLPPPPGYGSHDAPVRSFSSWVRGSWSWQHRLSVELLAALVVFFATGEIAEAIATGEARTLETVTYEAMDREVDVGFRVTETVRDGDVVWLAGTAGEVARFDAATGELATVEVTVASLAADPDGAGVVALAPGRPTRLLGLDATDDGAVELAVLEGGFPGDLAVHDGHAWVLASDGRLGAWDLGGGAPVRVVEGPAGSDLQVGDSGVWTRHEPSEADDGISVSEVRYLRRDPADLEVLLDTDEQRLATFGMTDLYVPGSGPPWVVTEDRVARLDPATGELRDGQRHAAVPTLDRDVPELRLVGVRDDAPTAVTVPKGVLSPIDGQAEARTFHYDTVQDVHVIGGETWLVVVDDRSTYFGGDDGRPGRLARWDGP